MGYPYILRSSVLILACGSYKGKPARCSCRPSAGAKTPLRSWTYELDAFPPHLHGDAHDDLPVGLGCRSLTSAVDLLGFKNWVIWNTGLIRLTLKTHGAMRCYESYLLAQTGEKKTSALLIKQSQSSGLRAKVTGPLMIQSPWDASGKPATNSAKRLRIH